MRIAVLLSGGVDSSVALRLLKEQGHQLTAFYLKIWLADDASFLASCPWQEDLDYARAVCDQVGVPLQILPLHRAYYERVVRYALKELTAGRTPSPDLFCNKRIKFGAFFEGIDRSFAKVATGHYARLKAGKAKITLLRSPDPVKDQTYFLAHLGQEQLVRALFPVGAMTKKEVRELAASYDLPTKERKDSQGVCFLGRINFRDFIRFFLGERTGSIVEHSSQRVLGEHPGYWYYTVGQRSGLGLGGGPWYVVQKDRQRNIVYVAHQEILDRYARKRFRVGDFNWINAPPGEQLLKKLLVKVRHGAGLYRATLELDRPSGRKRATRGTGGTEGGGEVRLSESDPGIAPGQFAVFYDGDICLGCGTILD